MGKLTQGPARLATAPVRLSGRKVEANGPGPERRLNPLRHLYARKEWRVTRWDVLVRDLFTCRMCGKGPQVDHSQLVADHIVRPNGDEALFWSKPNLQTLCKSPCHDQVKQREEAAARHTLGHWI